jgi:hypothetical protein
MGRDDPLNGIPPYLRKPDAYWHIPQMGSMANVTVAQWDEPDENGHPIRQLTYTRPSGEHCGTSDVGDFVVEAVKIIAEMQGRTG